MLQSRPAVRFSHRYQASFALICPLRPLGIHQENPPSALAGHTEPLAKCKGCMRWMQAECDRPEQWLHPEPRRSKWRLLQQSLKPKPIKLLRLFSIFIKRSIYFTYFFFIFRLLIVFFFSFSICYFDICSSLLRFKKETGSSDPWALPAVPLSVCLAIYSLSLTELQKCWEFCNYILGTESWSVYCQTK